MAEHIYAGLGAILFPDDAGMSARFTEFVISRWTKPSPASPTMFLHLIGAFEAATSTPISQAARVRAFYEYFHANLEEFLETGLLPEQIRALEERHPSGSPPEIPFRNPSYFTPDRPSVSSLGATSAAA